MKNKHYFLRLAIIKTMLTGLMYLMMPLAANFYNDYIPDGYFGYTIFGAGIMIIGNLILLVRAWAFALDKDLRKDFLNND